MHLWKREKCSIKQGSLLRFRSKVNNSEFALLLEKFHSHENVVFDVSVKRTSYPLPSFDIRKQRKLAHEEESLPGILMF